MTSEVSPRRSLHLLPLVLVGVGVAVRLLLFASPLLSPLLQFTAVEWSVGRWRWKALRESAWWLTQQRHHSTALNSSFSSSPVLAQSTAVQSASPLLLLLLLPFSSSPSPSPSSFSLLLDDSFTPLLFLFLDCAIAWNLRQFARSALRLLTSPSPSPLLLLSLPDVVALCYFLNPVTVLSLMSRSLVVVPHFLLTSALHRGSEGDIWTSMASLVLLLGIDRSYIALLPALLTLLIQSTAAAGWRTTMHCIVALTVWSGICLLLLSPLYSSSLSSTLSAVFWLSTSVDLTPNVGLFWYFWIQMFDRFRHFFYATITFLPLPLLLPLGPLLPPFKARPHITACIACNIHQALQQQTVMGGLSLHLCLLLLCCGLLPSTMPRLYLPALLMTLTGVLLPLMWFLWIGPGSGNANFFYFQSLLLMFSYLYCIVEVVKAVRRDAIKRRRETEVYAAVEGLKQSKELLLEEKQQQRPPAVT